MSLAFTASLSSEPTLGRFVLPSSSTPTPTPPTTVSATPAALDVEREIARLTWLVLDGKAKMEERQRLAVLVSAQHAHRTRGV